MSLPRTLSAAVEHVLGAPVTGATPVGGGSINRAHRIDAANGHSYFLKWNRNAPRGMFEAEVDGLSALRDANRVRVPEPVSHGTDDDGTAFLLMEYVVPGASTAAYHTRLGHGLAAIHTAETSAGFGWSRDNWIGLLEQRNNTETSWAEFWREHRIRPQLDRARARGMLSDSALDDLLDRIPAALEGVERASLLHGDLWSGNVFADEAGEPVLIDPAVHRGHSEVDLAMSELFGGFGRRFYEAYDETIPIPDEYTEFRRDLYQLYYLLVHVNLFGTSYEPGSLAAARRVIAALG